MSRREDRYQAERWLATADDDRRAAEVLVEGELYAHACFTAQQCGEKAVKGLWYGRGADPRGHSIQRLVAQCPVEAVAADQEWLETAAQLDRFYIPTRYPNGLPDLTPEQSFFRRDAEEALQRATWLLEACRRLLAEM